MSLNGIRNLKILLLSVSFTGLFGISTLSYSHGESCSSGRFAIDVGEERKARFLSFWEKDRLVKICGIVSSVNGSTRQRAKLFSARIEYYKKGSPDFISIIIEENTNTDSIRSCHFLDGHRFRLVLGDTVGKRKFNVVYSYDFCVVPES